MRHMNRALKLVRQTEPLYATVRAARDMYSCAIGARCGSFSQHGEDTFIHEGFGRKKGDFYVDVGAYHPIRLSNTFLLYKNGWRGVTAELIRSRDRQLFMRLFPRGGDGQGGQLPDHSADVAVGSGRAAASRGA